MDQDNFDIIREGKVITKHSLVVDVFELRVNERNIATSGQPRSLQGGREFIVPSSRRNNGSYHGIEPDGILTVCHRHVIAAIQIVAVKFSITIPSPACKDCVAVLAGRRIGHKNRSRY